MAEQRTTGVVVRKILRAIGEWDLDTYRSLLAADAIEHRPQLGLRFVGRDAIMGMYRGFTGPAPTIDWRRITGEGTVWVGQGRIDYGTTDRPPDHVVAVLTVEAGKITRIDYYFADQLPPAEHHLKWGQPETR